MIGEDWVVEAKAARREGRLREAATLYERAAEAYRAAADLPHWAHALRHAAELAVEAGDPPAALRYAITVLEHYRSHPPSTLELANALRVAALASEASNEHDHAEAHWREARELYSAEHIPDGVDEADRHIHPATTS